MKYFRLISCISAVLILLFTSCKKESKETQAEHRLPNYGNINFDNIFTAKDEYLENEAFVKDFLNRYYKTVWEDGNLWGGILVAKGDKILLEKYRGFAQDNEQQPITAETPMHVASVSKTLTAMAILKLVEAKKISLDDKLTAFFPKFPYPKVTVQTLLSQRSGLPKYEHFVEQLPTDTPELSKKFLTNKDILNILIKYKPELARETDTGFMYCNTNYALLALILEKVTGFSFPEAMKLMVFKPLKMNHSYIFTEKDTVTAAKSFYSRGPSVYPYDRLDLIYGDKNVYTTPRDLFQFSKAMFSKDFLNEDLKNKIFTPYSNEKPGVNNYGLGFRMKIFDQNEKLTYHNGWWHGSNSIFAHLLKSKVTIVAIGNKYSNRVYSALALSALFENFPYETQKLDKAMNNGDAINGQNLPSSDSANSNSDMYSE